MPSYLICEDNILNPKQEVGHHTATEAIWAFSSKTPGINPGYISTSTMYQRHRLRTGQLDE